MSCAEVQAELVGYHFGEVEPDLRGEIEVHLQDCRPCLVEFLGLKRAFETASTEEAPSPEAKRRLREAVARQLGAPPARRRGWSWWERPVALLCATAAVLAALFVLQLLSSGSGAMPRSLSNQPRPGAPAVLR